VSYSQRYLVVGLVWLGLLLTVMVVGWHYISTIVNRTPWTNRLPYQWC